MHCFGASCWIFQGFLFSPACWNLWAQPKRLCMMSFTASSFLLAFQLSRWLQVSCCWWSPPKNLTAARAKLVTWVPFKFSCLACRTIMLLRYLISSARSCSKMVAFLTLTLSQINVDLASDEKASSWQYALVDTVIDLSNFSWPIGQVQHRSFFKNSTSIIQYPKTQTNISMIHKFDIVFNVIRCWFDPGYS